jgi:membrane associated rhomboid family serine protease
VKNNPFVHQLGPAALPGLVVIAVLWLVQWAQHLFSFPMYRWGVLPQTLEGFKGIFFMAFIHDKHDLHHVINNSIAFFFLSTLLVYAYREVFVKVYLWSWFLCGTLLWFFAEDHGSYHIGLSGIIYALFSFLFVSGVLRAYFPLQALSLLVVFLYGSLIWGIFPINQYISWEGHLAGFIAGLILAFAFRKVGPTRPKYAYEIEKEMGIEPPDWEKEWNEENAAQSVEASSSKPITIHYDYLPKNESPPKAENDGLSPLFPRPESEDRQR